MKKWTTKWKWGLKEKFEENKHHIHEKCAIPYFGDVEQMSCISPHNEMRCIVQCYL
jgi:hypothetical protein